MSQSDLSLGLDDPLDDLPRTFRREKEARDRAAQAAGPSGFANPPQNYRDARSWNADKAPAVTVAALDIPFFHLMFFFIKAVLAAVPAIILLGVILWTAGDLLSTYFPWLVKVKLLIHVPPA